MEPVAGVQCMGRGVKPMARAQHLGRGVKSMAGAQHLGAQAARVIKSRVVQCLDSGQSATPWVSLHAALGRKTYGKSTVPMGKAARSSGHHSTHQSSLKERSTHLQARSTQNKITLEASTGA